MHLQESFIITDGVASVPTVTLTRGSTTVVLVGMLHIARRAFFDDVLSRLLAYEKDGFQILYEEVEGTPSADKETIDTLLKGLAKYDLYGQLDCIQPRKTWKSADVYQEKQNDVPLDESADLGFDPHDLQDPERFVRNILLPQLEDPTITMPNEDFIIGTRNAYAVKAILRFIEHGNVATYWGCAHLPGMIELLEKHGFSLVHIEWTPVINLTHIKQILSASK